MPSRAIARSWARPIQPRRLPARSARSTQNRSAKILSTARTHPTRHNIRSRNYFRATKPSSEGTGTAWRFGALARPRLWLVDYYGLGRAIEKICPRGGKGTSGGFAFTNDGSGPLARHGHERLERDRPGHLLGGPAADHVDQHPAIRRQHGRHRDGVRRAAPPATGV